MAADPIQADLTMEAQLAAPAVKLVAPAAVEPEARVAAGPAAQAAVEPEARAAAGLVAQAAAGPAARAAARAVLEDQAAVARVVHPLCWT
ncbi:hypothetical protein B7W85_02060 [Allorhizobium ampelinum]|nr:hypothetical protein B7W85_02060 [Allorhizobium ampelinum]